MAISWFVGAFEGKFRTLRHTGGVIAIAGGINTPEKVALCIQSGENRRYSTRRIRAPSLPPEGTVCLLPGLLSGCPAPAFPRAHLAACLSVFLAVCLSVGSSVGESA